jgi:hypothetical protein
VLHAVREHEHLECPALLLEYNMARESSVCRERIVNISTVKIVRQNQELFITHQQVVHHGYCVVLCADKDETSVDNICRRFSCIFLRERQK